MAAVLAARALSVPAPVDPDPETRRRARVQSPAIGFLGGIILLATVIAVIAVVVWAVL